MSARRRPTANTAVSRHITPHLGLGSEPALGQLSGLFIHNHPFKSSVVHREVRRLYMWESHSLIDLDRRDHDNVT
jgi:hypothetical protein